MEQNRIRLLIDALGMRPNEFAKSLSISNQCLNNWMNRYVTKKTALFINRFYPNVNVSWLITGTGEMFVPNKVFNSSLPNNENDILQKRVLYLERENERLLNIIERYIIKH